MVCVAVWELSLHGIVSAEEVADGLVVAHHLLALECRWHAAKNRTVGSAELWCHSDNSLLLHVFLWEITIDSDRDITSLCLHWVWGDVEIVS